MPSPAVTASEGDRRRETVSIEHSTSTAGADRFARLRNALLGTSKRQNLCVAIIFAIVSVALVASYMHAAPKLSPIDELQHFDYIVKAPHIPRAGEALSQEAMRTEACRGIDYPDFKLPACNLTTFDPLTFQEGGRSTASIHPPPYYYVTAVVARALTGVTGMSLFAASRLVGALWLFLGLWVAWCAGRRLKAPPVGLLGMLLLVSATPFVWTAVGNINPDATALLVGGGTLWLAIRWDRGAIRWFALAAAGLLSVMFKVNQIIAIAPVCTLLIVSAVTRARLQHEGDSARASSTTPDALSTQNTTTRDTTTRDTTTRDTTTRRTTARGWLTGLAWAAVPAVIAVVFVLVQNAIVNARTIQATAGLASIYTATSIRASDILSTWHVFLPPNAELPYQTPVLTNHPLMAFTNTLLAGMFLIGVAYAVLTPAIDRTIRILAGSTLIWMVLGGPLYTAANFIISGLKFPVLPARYGLVLLVPLAIVVATVARPIRLQRTILAFGVAYVGYTVLISWRANTIVI